eukprot:scaffold85078_cov18-Prasinocladus_malaysianus.AAC.1
MEDLSTHDEMLPTNLDSGIRPLGQKTSTCQCSAPRSFYDYIVPFRAFPGTARSGGEHVLLLGRGQRTIL